MPTRLLRPTALLVALAPALALSACGPSMTLPPPIPLGTGDLTQETGGAVATSFRSNRDELNIDGQLWYMTRANAKRDVGMLVFLGQTSFLGIGGTARQYLLKTDDTALGIDAQLGFFWVALGAPASYQLTDGLWIFTNPSVGYRFAPFKVPLGVSFQLTDQARLDIELMANFGTSLIDQAPTNRFFYPQASTALAWRF